MCERQQDMIDIAHVRVDDDVVVDQWMRISCDGGLRYTLNTLVLGTWSNLIIFR